MQSPRRTLRQRCKSNLKVNTKLPADLDKSPWIVKADTVGRRTSRKGQCRPALQGKIQSTSSIATPSLCPRALCRSPPLFEDFYELIPYLSLAYCDEDFSPTAAALFIRPPYSNSNDFTHFVKIEEAQSPAQYGTYRLEVNADTGVQTLVLPIHLPPSRCVTGVASTARRVRQRPRDYSILADRQIAAARDFLALALPHYPQQGSRAGTPPPDECHVLMTAPRRAGTAADLMSIAVAYVAFMSALPVGHIIEHMEDAIESWGQEWTGAIGEEGSELVERVVEWEWSKEGRIYPRRHKRLRYECNEHL